MPTVTHANGQVQIVKNLGYLTRYLDCVEWVTVSPQHWFNNPMQGFEVRMVASLKVDGVRRFYHANFVNKQVCLKWIATRKMLKGVPVAIHE